MSCYVFPLARKAQCCSSIPRPEILTSINIAAIFIAVATCGDQASEDEMVVRPAGSIGHGASPRPEYQTWLGPGEKMPLMGRKVSRSHWRFDAAKQPLKVLRPMEAAGKTKET